MHTKDRILAMAREMIADGGYHATTTAALAARANISEGTIYRHFKSKEDILIRILEDLDESYSGFLLELRSKMSGGEGTIEIVVKEHSKFVEDNVDAMRIVLSSYAHLDPSKQSMTSVIQRMSSFFEEHLKHAIDDGIIDKVPPRENAMLMVTLLLGLMRLKLYWPEIGNLTESAVVFCRRSLGTGENGR